MNRVLLVCSAHRETGYATPGELSWLLGRLQPDVIFLEHSSADFNRFLDGSCGTLEAAAVLQYRSRNATGLVPVDLELQQHEELKRKFDELFDRVGNASAKFVQLDVTHRYHTARGGFAYLNSPLCVALQSEMQNEMRATVANVADRSLEELYALWNITNNCREAAMLNGVEGFARQFPFKKGVLLVGAAHRQPLLERAQLCRSDWPSPVAWEFEWEFEESP